MLSSNKQIALWLFACCVMVAIMVTIGGVTRLTDSGLSMTGWKPVTGWLPPIGYESWIEEFSRYRQSPEYLKINFGMSLDDFKGIFWLEYIHRLAGRITGLVFFIPLIFFMFKKKIDKPLAVKLFAILLLGGIQGVIGWLMVSSGLKDAPHVSQYWLAFHLCMAFILFALLFLLGLKQYYHGCQMPKVDNGYYKFSIFLSVMIFVQVFMGGLVAGLNAGLIYNTFPLMEGKVIPDELFIMQPWYLNIFENVKTVQFNHRMIAYTVSVLIVIFCYLHRKSKINYAIAVLFVMLLIQFNLGVLTLLKHVPVNLASLHQVGALILFSVSLYINFIMMPKKSKGK